MAREKTREVRIPIYFYRDKTGANYDYVVDFRANLRLVSNWWSSPAASCSGEFRHKELHAYTPLRLRPGEGPVKAELVVTIPAKTAKKGK